MNVMYLMLSGILIRAVYTDLTRTKISNRLILLGLLLGLISRIFGEGGIGILVYIVNISIPVILLYLLFQLQVLGAGDIKLFSVIGAFIPMEQLLQVIWKSFCVGAVIGIVKMIHQRMTMETKIRQWTMIHFSVPILVAYLMTIWRCI